MSLLILSAISGLYIKRLYPLAWGASRFEKLNDKIQEYLHARGLPTAGNKDELVALLFRASFFSIEQKASAKDALLKRCSNVLPHPLADINNKWVGEAKGMCMWSPCMYCYLAEYLAETSECDLQKCLLSDYKKGKELFFVLRFEMAEGVLSPYVTRLCILFHEGRMNPPPRTSTIIPTKYG